MQPHMSECYHELAAVLSQFGCELLSCAFVIDVVQLNFKVLEGLDPVSLYNPQKSNFNSVPDKGKSLRDSANSIYIAIAIFAFVDD